MKLSIRTKLLLLLVLLISICITLIFGQAYNVAFKDMANNAKSNTRLYAKDISALIEERLENIKEKVLLAVVSDRVIASGSEIIFERSPEVLAIAKYSITSSAVQPQRQSLLLNPRYSKSKEINNNTFDNLERNVDFESTLKDNEYLNVGKLINYQNEVILYTFPIKIPEVPGLQVFVAILIPDLILTAVNSNSEKYVNYLVDDQGRILVHPNTVQIGKSISKLDIFKGFFESGVLAERTMEYTDENSQKVIGSMFKVRRSNIGILSKILASDAYAEAEKLKIILIISSIFVFIFTFIIGLFFARSLIDPLLKLSRITGEIARGNFLVGVDVKAHDEIGELAESFKKMGHELYARENELQAAQAALIQSEKMSALGQISAGIAHEVKNPLTGILGHAQLSREKLLKSCSPQEVDKSLEIIEKETKRCKDIIENLMKFSRQEKAIMVRDDISKIIKSSINLVDHQLTINGVKITQEITEGLEPVLINANQIEQVMLNLLLNAQHAMENQQMKNLTVRVKDSGNGYARIEIQDTGCGMNATVKKRIFEPFFTTKPSGQGTGLGLSVSFGIIKSHKGIINVESEEGVGTKFILDIPYEKTIASQVSDDNTSSGIWTDPKEPVVMRASQMPMPVKHPEKEANGGGYRGEDPIIVKPTVKPTDDTEPSVQKNEMKVAPPKPKPQVIPEAPKEEIPPLPSLPSKPAESEEEQKQATQEKLEQPEQKVELKPEPKPETKKDLEYIPRKKSISNVEIKRPTRRS